MVFSLVVLFVKRCRPQGQRFIKRDAELERDSFDPVVSHLRRVAEVAAHTEDRGLLAKWEHLLQEARTPDPSSHN